MPGPNWLFVVQIVVSLPGVLFACVRPRWAVVTAAVPALLCALFWWAGVHWWTLLLLLGVNLLLMAASACSPARDSDSLDPIRKVHLVWHQAVESWSVPLLLVIVAAATAKDALEGVRAWQRRRQEDKVRRLLVRYEELDWEYVRQGTSPRERASRWWSSNDWESGLCDDCGTNIPRGDGYLVHCARTPPRFPSWTRDAAMVTSLQRASPDLVCQRCFKRHDPSAY